MNAARLLSGLFLAASLGCGDQRIVPFLVSEVDFDADLSGNENAIAGDENALPELAAIFAPLGFDLEALLRESFARGELIAVELRASRFTTDRSDVEIRLYSAVLVNNDGVPEFNSGDIIDDGEPSATFLGAELVRGEVRTEPSGMLLPLAIDPALLALLPLRSATLHGVVGPTDNPDFGGRQELDGATLRGVVRAADFAAFVGRLDETLEGLTLREGEAFAGRVGLDAQFARCADGAGCDFGAEAGVCSARVGEGVCLGAESAPARCLAAFDADGDGRIAADFNALEGAFLENELAPLFDLVDGAVSGSAGALFRLDTDGDGRPDAMGAGFGLATVPSSRNFI
jgi:hypothetical protein